MALQEAPDDPFAIRLLYSPQDPTPPQHAFLLLDDLGVRDALYGGAGGGGKSSALLMSAARYVDVPGYSALLIRRTYADLALPGALMDRAKEWWLGKRGVHWDAGLFRFTFPSGASITFGYLQTAMDKYRYQGAEFQFIGVDELTQIPPADVRYLFTRLRRPMLTAETTRDQRERIQNLGRVPLRFRAATNPGGRSHEYVKARYITKVPAATLAPDHPDFDVEDTPTKAGARVFIPAKLADNPHIDQEGYRESLASVDPHLRAQMLDGDWDARPPGNWVYDHRGLRCAFELGRRLDLLLAEGRAPRPAGGVLDSGLDWGEHTHGLIGWPLELGGMWVVAGEELVGSEPSASAAAVIDLAERVVALGQRGPVPVFSPMDEPLQVLASHRFDAAGVQSMRTYMAVVRRRTPGARSTSVAFGKPIQTGGSGATRSFKAETIGFLRRMVLRSLAEVDFGGDVRAMVDGRLARESWDDRRRELEADSIRRVGYLAVSPSRAPELVRQLPLLEFSDVELGRIAKGDDHGPDALIALVAPVAARNR